MLKREGDRLVRQGFAEFLPEANRARPRRGSPYSMAGYLPSRTAPFNRPGEAITMTT